MVGGMMMWRGGERQGRQGGKTQDGGEVVLKAPVNVSRKQLQPDWTVTRKNWTISHSHSHSRIKNRRKPVIKDWL
jgi:hypothetical protein